MGRNEQFFNRGRLRPARSHAIEKLRVEIDPHNRQWAKGRSTNVLTTLFVGHDTFHFTATFWDAHLAIYSNPNSKTPLGNNNALIRPRHASCPLLSSASGELLGLVIFIKTLGIAVRRVFTTNSF